ncbi:CARDB domain-containing protein [Paenibacillus rigui]|nr:CARDB domain-containing protein [Paenibacillus rigui]
MAVYTNWLATTYLYKDATITINYDEPTKPDLGYISATGPSGCIKAGTSAEITFNYKNFGPSTSATFKVEYKVNGVVNPSYTETISGASSGQTFTKKITYSFSTTAPQDFTIVIDAGNAVGEATNTLANNSTTVSVTAQSDCNGGGNGGCYAPDLIGTVKVDKSFISWGQANYVTGTLQDTSVNYKFKFRFWQNGVSTDLPDGTWSNKGTAGFEANYYKQTNGAYPGGFADGDVTVEFVVWDQGTNCITSIGGAHFEVGPKPANRPPNFQIGWFKASNTTGTQPDANNDPSVVVGDKVNLRAFNISDPDGDAVTMTWQFSSSTSTWVQGLKSTYGLNVNDLKFTNLLTTTKGAHLITARACDPSGLCSTQSDTLNVVSPYPIPCINVPSRVVAGRTLAANAINGDCSTAAPGRTIDHTKDEWTNKRDVYPAPGPETVTLEVTDNKGVHSLPEDKAVKVINVVEDKPPIAELIYPSVMTRGTFSVTNNTRSIDGDTIVDGQLKYWFDSNNDGNFNDETGYVVDHFMPGQSYSIQAASVGKIKFYIWGVEDYGLSDSKTYTADVINQSGETDVSIMGSNPEPPELDIIRYKTQDLLLKDSWKGSIIGIGDTDKVRQNGLQLNLSTDSLGVINSSNPYSMGVLPGSMATSHYRYEGLANDYVDVALPEALPKGFTYGGSDLRFPVAGTMANASNPDNKADLQILSGNLGSNVAMSGGRDNAGNTFSFECLYSGSGPYQYTCSIVVQLAGGGGYTVPYHNGQSITTTDLTKITGLFGGIRHLSDSSYWGFIYDVCQYWDDEYNSCGYSVTKTDFYKTSDGSYTSTIPYSAGVTLEPVPLVWESPTYMLNGKRVTAKTTVQPVSSSSNDDYYTFSLEYYDANTKTSKTVKVRDKVKYNQGYTSVGKDSATISYKNLSFQIRVSSDGYVFALVNADSVEVYDMNGAFVKSFYIGKSFFSSYLHYDNSDSSEESKQFYLHYFDFEQDGTLTVALTQRDHAKYRDGTRGIVYKPTNENFREYWVYRIQATGAASIPYETIAGGQLRNEDHVVAEGDYAFYMNLGQRVTTNNSTSGFSFRMQDYKNMYRFEATSTTLFLSKIVDGNRIILGQAAYNFAENTWYGISIVTKGSKMKVAVNGSPVFDVSDGTFGEGKYGPFLNLYGVKFKGLTVTTPRPKETKIDGIAVVNMPIVTTPSYTDPEGDPNFPNQDRFYYSQVDGGGFLDAGDGASGTFSRNGQPQNPALASLDKVGNYKVQYVTQDDPAPAPWLSSAYAAYRQDTTGNIRNLLVHRKPIADFSVSQGSDYTISWTDKDSHDPDRWLASWNYIAGYGANKGIYDERYNYTDTAGVTHDGKITRPDQPGMYILRKAVKDEYGAWSDWAVASVYFDAAPPNNPPSAVITFPDGTESDPTPVSLHPTILWNQSDPDPGTTFTAFNLQVKDEWGNDIDTIQNQSMNTTDTSWSWTLDHSLEMGKKYQTVVQVSDGFAWSAWSNVGWMITNSPPAAYMSFPYGTQAEPTIVTTLRPTLQWVQSDPDAGTLFQHFQLQITNEDNNVMMLDSGKLAQNTSAGSNQWVVPNDLPSGQKLRVRVKVWDQYGAESIWSPQVWMYINRPPTANFDWTPKPAFEGDEVTLWNQSTDPDGDTLSYSWQVTGPGYNTAALHTSIHAVIPAAVTDGYPGDYIVTLTVNDSHGASDTITKAVPVGDLSLDGYVKHTPGWEENRKAYNFMKSRNTEQPRSSDTFWSGEAFVVEAETNQPADQVTVRMSYTNMQANLTAAAGRMTWKGQLERGDFETLPDGDYSFHFTAVWPNGHRETAVRVIKIKDPWTAYSSSVRKE